jgi:hypothetical protein
MQWNVVGEPWNLLTFNFVVALLLLVCAGVLLVRRDYALGTYTLLAVLLALSSGSLQSMGRYALVVFTVLLAGDDGALRASCGGFLELCGPHRNSSRLAAGTSASRVETSKRSMSQQK